LKNVLPSFFYLFVFRKTERSKDKSISWDSFPFLYETFDTTFRGSFGWDHQLKMESMKRIQRSFFSHFLFLLAILKETGIGAGNGLTVRGGHG
jgi:hypothetical protein